MHSSLIPVGPHRGKVLVWDRSSSFLCSLHNGVASGDRDQRWAIVDPEAQTVLHQAWTIPAQFAPPVHRTWAQLPNITHGAQGLFCSGHCWLPDGRFLVVGGDDWLSGASAGYADYTGSRMVAIYDPLGGPNGTWSTLRQLNPTGPAPFLEVPRWYPTAVVTYDPTQTLRAVKVLVLDGIEEYTPGPDSDLPAPTNGLFLATDRGYLTHEAYDIVEAGPGQPWVISKDTRQGGTLPINYSPNTPIPGLFIGPSTASSVSIPDFRLGLSLFYYTRAHYLSSGALGGNTTANGVVWCAGMAMDTAWIDHPTNPNYWGPQQPVIKQGYAMLEEPTGVLLPASLGGGGEDRIALFGGEYGMNHSGPITADVHVLDARSATPSWSPMVIPAMQHARKFANAVLLPDSSVLVVGGGTNPNHGGPGGRVLHPEVFRGTIWEECAPETSPRTYHSCALLLPSGRVATMGGDSRTWDVQVFEPHYFGPTDQQHLRPIINQASVPATIGYNTTFSVGFTLATGRSLQRACLIAPGSLTHSHDPNQRLVDLPIVTSNSTTATLGTPVNPTKAPFGHYMLFLVDSAGEVSAAAWTRML